MKNFLKVTKALSNPNRIKIIKMLQKGPACVCQLHAAIGIAQPTMSKHLKLLERAGLVAFDKQGSRVRYRVTSGASSPYAAGLLGYLRHWLEEDPEIMKLYEIPVSRAEQ